MMREILFRGKRIANGEWYYGSYLFLHKSPVDWTGAERGKSENVHYIINDQDINYAVDPSTVGQYTGLTDKNGKRIFEGDIVEGREYTDEDGYGVVEWDDGAYEVGNKSWCGTFHENYNGCEFEVIGNIHDNPELLNEANP